MSVTLMTFPTAAETPSAVAPCLALCPDRRIAPIGMTKFPNMRARFSAISPRGSPFQGPKPALNYVTLPTYPPLARPGDSTPRGNRP